MRTINLTLPKLTKQEKENVQSMTIWKAYQKELSNAENMKTIYEKCKIAISNGVNIEQAMSGKIYFYNEAIESWNKAQKLLADFNEFESNRKYK
jgi:hypothetical protein